MNSSWSSNDVICADRFLAAFPANYMKTDAFYTDRTFSWRGKLVTAPSSSQRLILAGHSDYPITDNIVSRYPHAKWFAINSCSTRVTGLPLGITNNTDESALHRIYGNTDVMVHVAKTPRTIKNLAYLNFSVETYPSERAPLKEMFRATPWVTHGSPVNTLEGRQNFLEEIRNHVFTFCPRGNGIDTHRLWETLYMGGIPIVKRDIVHAGWTDLPILFIDNWNEITYDRLLFEQKRITSITWNTEKLRVGYWIDLIQQSSK